MARALFITANELKKNSIIDGNVDNDKIVQYIKVAQDTHIQNYLGTNLYNKIESLLIAGTMDDIGNAAYKSLWVNYIKPMHTWYSQVSFLPFAMFQITNGGVYKHGSETGETITLEEMRSMLDNARSNAEFYTTRFIDYVCDNETDFPEYVTTSSNSDMYPDRDTNFSGWVL